jgi:hypothetical protein
MYYAILSYGEKDKKLHGIQCGLLKKEQNIYFKNMDSNYHFENMKIITKEEFIENWQKFLIQAEIVEFSRFEGFK